MTDKIRMRVIEDKVILERKVKDLEILVSMLKFQNEDFERVLRMSAKTLLNYRAEVYQLKKKERVWKNHAQSYWQACFQWLWFVATGLPYRIRLRAPRPRRRFPRLRLLRRQSK